MKRNTAKFGLVAIVAALFMMVSTGAFANVICPDMKIVKTGSKILGGAQVNIVRAQIATKTCGDMTASDKRTFNFSDLNGDAGLATALTAFSLGLNVYMVLTDDNAAAGTTVETIQISAP